MLALKLSVRLGTLAEVGVLSVTVAVQLVGLPTGTVSGAQLTTVLGACLFAVTTKLPALLRCEVSPPHLRPLVSAPTTTAGYLSAQLELTAPVTGSVLAPPRLRLLPLKPPSPGIFFFNDTATAEIYALSLHDALPISVAVQLVGLPTGTVSGAQLTTVLVACLFAVTTKLPALLRCVVSPL